MTSFQRQAAGQGTPSKRVAATLSRIMASELRVLREQRIALPYPAELPSLGYPPWRQAAMCSDVLVLLYEHETTYTQGDVELHAALPGDPTTRLLHRWRGVCTYCAWSLRPIGSRRLAVFSTHDHRLDEAVHEVGDSSLRVGTLDWMPDWLAAFGETAHGFVTGQRPPSHEDKGPFVVRWHDTDGRVTKTTDVPIEVISTNSVSDAAWDVAEVDDRLFVIFDEKHLVGLRNGQLETMHTFARGSPTFARGSRGYLVQDGTAATWLVSIQARGGIAAAKLTADGLEPIRVETPADVLADHIASVAGGFLALDGVLQDEPPLLHLFQIHDKEARRVQRVRPRGTAGAWLVPSDRRDQIALLSMDEPDAVWLQVLGTHEQSGR